MINNDIEKEKEFDGHRFVSFLYDKDNNLKGFVAIHRGGVVGPALGATRVWKYKNEKEALNDALRLSRLMSYKSALAGLPYGGAKAALIEPKGGIKNRKEFFSVYAKRVNYLGGHFVTGTDVGVTNDDVKIMSEVSPNFIGNKVDPAYFTGEGVIVGIKTSLKEVFGSDSVSGKTFAIQGLGKTGSSVANLLYKNGAKKIYITDENQDKIKSFSKLDKIFESTPKADIHKKKVDVFIPCALSGILNQKSIKEIKAKIICGSANNQLESKYAGELLYKKGILYAPDYVVNAGGIIAVADELQSNSNPDDKRIMRKVLDIEKTLLKIFMESKSKKLSTSFVADSMAEAIFNSKEL